jgi:hypothetical protein
MAIGQGKWLILLLVCFVLVSCVAAPIPLSPEASQVRIGKSDAGEGYLEVGAITATHGGGCGAYGSRGTYEGAYAILKNKAATLGADYVQIFTMSEPHPTGGCFVNAYTITGTAYRK